jgi:hypothetical protein
VMFKRYGVEPARRPMNDVILAKAFELPLVPASPTSPLGPEAAEA